MISSDKSEELEFVPFAAAGSLDICYHVGICRLGQANRRGGEAQVLVAIRAQALKLSAKCAATRCGPFEIKKIINPGAGIFMSITWKISPGGNFP